MSSAQQPIGPEIMSMEQPRTITARPELVRVSRDHEEV
jgi:hypothetical protein